MAVHFEFDESGDSKIILVSMQVATAEKAKKVKKAWCAELARAKVPFFHAVDFKKGMGEGVFGHMGRPERMMHLATLSSIVRTKVGIGLSAWVDIKQYEQKTTPDYRSEFGTAYAHAIHTLVLGGYLYCKAFHLGFDVHILIEGGHKNSDQVLQILRDLQKGNGHPDALLNILTVGAGCKKDSPLLQAADMLAYGEWQKLINGRLEIHDALHVDDSRYKPEMIDVTDEIVDTFVSGAADSKARVALEKKLWWERTRSDRQNEESKRRIQEVRSDNGRTSESSAPGDQGEAGEREGAETQEKAGGMRKTH